MATATQTAKQMLTQLAQQPMQVVRNTPKPIFVMRVPTTLTSAEIDELRNGVAKDNISDDYHILVVPSFVSEFQFEMYNADKIEKQEWNKLVNQILK